MEFAEEETFPEDNENRNEFVREGEDSKEPGRLNPVGVIVPAAVLICGLAAAILKGYLPHVEMENIREKIRMERSRRKSVRAEMGGQII